MTYRKPVYLKSFPSANNCQIYFSIYYHFLKWFIKQTQLFFFFFGLLFPLHTSRSHFIIISEAGVWHARRGGRLCVCFTQKWAVITGAESHSCPLAGDATDQLHLPVKVVALEESPVRFFEITSVLLVIVFKPTAFWRGGISSPVVRPGKTCASEIPFP